MTLRPKPSLRVAAVVALLGLIGWLVVSPAIGTLVGVGFALLVVVWSFRALVVVRDDVVSQRGLFGWRVRELRLDELTAVSLRLRWHGRFYLPLTLELSGPSRLEVSVDCWAWDGWQELAHRAGHFARQLGVRLDEATDHRTACTSPGCTFEPHAAVVAAGRRAGEPPDDSLASLSSRQALLIIGLAFFVFSAGGLARSLFLPERDASPLQTGLLIGAVHAGFLGAAVACAKVYRRVSPPGSRTSGWLGSTRDVTPPRVIVGAVGVLAFLSLLLFAFLPYQASNDRGEEQRCGSPLFEASGHGAATGAPADPGPGTVLQGEPACRAEGKQRLGVLAVLATATSAGLAAVWLLVGGSGPSSATGGVGRR